MKTKLALALAVTLLAAPAAAQAQTTPPPSDDPQVIGMRALIAERAPIVQLPACDQIAEPARWTNVGTPDKGRERPIISAHRGSLTYAPENTLAAYEYAFALGVELVEVDIQETKDGKFVALHDSTVDRTTDGTGNVTTLTYDEVRALNAADYAPWKGGPYDRSQVASLEEVLALAKRVGGGVELDFKQISNAAGVAELVKQYGLVEKSIFNSADLRIWQVAPGARMIYNRDRWEPSFLMYEIAKIAPIFGSRRDEYDAESIAAIHDNCGIVMPHAYDAGEAEEVNEFHRARAMGADGVQTNQPEAIVAAAGIPAPSTILRSDNEVCLVNRDHTDLGFPGKTLLVDGVERTTGRGGCVAAPGAAKVTFAGSGAVTPSTAAVTAVTGGVGGAVGGALELTLPAAPSFGAFLPGVEKEYTTSTEATVLSTAGNATLSVSEPGHLKNGAFSLPQPLRVDIAPSFWPGPVTAAKSLITFKQSVAANDALRTGSYSTTLTFTLSTTAP